MTGTFINVITVIIGSILGIILGGRLPDRLRDTVISVLGLFTLGFGLHLFIQTQNSLVVLASLLVGVLLGEWWQVETGLQNLGVWLEQRFNHQSSGPTEVDNRFVRGFFITSLLFCVGPMAILGSIQDGLTGNYETLVIKSIMDGFAALAFASSLGIGVIFSALPVLVYQGSISLLAYQVQSVVTEAMMVELTAVGGVLLLGIAVSSLLEIRKIRVGNLLPALLIAPFMVALFTWLNLY